MKVGEIWLWKNGVTQIELIEYLGFDLWLCKSYIGNEKIAVIKYTGQKIIENYWKNKYMEKSL